jgi:hypothetical protein
MRMVVIMAVVGAAMFALARWLVQPAIDIDTFVETPEVWDRMFNQYDGIQSDKMRVTPRVNLDAPETVIRWPAFKSSRVDAQPLELRIRKGQWADKFQVSDRGFIGPAAVGLRVDWPEKDEERAKAGRDEELARVIYGRANLGRDFLYEEQFRSNREIKYATPLDSPRDQAVVIYCGSHGAVHCTLYFDHLGRPAQLTIPRRRFDDWEDALKRARQLLASVATPIKR